MIKIRATREGGCIACSKREDLYMKDITLEGNSFGTVVRLCRDCRLELLELLEKDEKEHDWRN